MQFSQVIAYKYSLKLHQKDVQSAHVNIQSVWRVVNIDA